MAASAILVARSEYDARTVAGERIDYDQGRILPMTNDDAEHDGIKGDLSGVLWRQLPPPF